MSDRDQDARGRSPDMRSALDEDTERALRVFISRISERYQVVCAVVFGSRARGDHHEDSDADLALVLRGDFDFLETIGWMGRTAFDVLLETGLLVEPLPLTEGQWEQCEAFANPRLLSTIQRDGIRLEIPAAD